MSAVRRRFGGWRPAFGGWIDGPGRSVPQSRGGGGAILGRLGENGRLIFLSAVQIHHLKDKNGNDGPAGAIPAKIEANGYKAYKYVDHEKLAKWIEDAATAAGK